MDIGLVGVGRMGAGIARHWLKAGHRVVAHDLDRDALAVLARDGVEPVDDLDALVAALPAPRTVWTMLPAGAPTRGVTAFLEDALAAGDLLIDGGNTNFHESVERAGRCRDRGLRFLDVGTSSGLLGRSDGYCLMVGGDPDLAAETMPLLRAIAPDGGCRYVGPSGSGHYVKMVHNGIEYGLLEAYAEGFEVLKASDYSLDLPAIAELWRHNSLVQSRLLDLLARKLDEDPELSKYSDYVEDLGTGRWTVLEAIDKDVPTPAITAALLTRLRSRQDRSFGGQVLSSLREEFGGHVVDRPTGPVS
ncbi:phosphogluconate dehydrogenase (NAD(+)-dependent, decarboxylating) [Cryptosporangium arvum]|uniref:6-phosphogluconate dehydrogenase, decarboxylating n=1 Tax=Cryptosporangium arvum DSM 44712 TaxID=927661 RepID=A0A010YQY5_9ACTN|nr:decarboxylating 6-phosphogluconate dehydrogenase [Cryptosporangium arvum]EXG82610.1 6-phosphogluconate dehydrogenase, decarboxylating [Cryptosporangium arvum DSM 44712]